MSRYAASSTDSLSRSRARRDSRDIGRSVTCCAAARLAACSSSRSMLNSSARRMSSLSQGESAERRPKARRNAPAPYLLSCPAATGGVKVATWRFVPAESGGIDGASGEHLFQGCGANGFAQVPLDPRFARQLATGVLAACRQCDQSQVLQARMLRETSGEVVTAHVGELEIDE